MSAKIYHLKDYREDCEETDICIDDAIADWIDVFYSKILEIYQEHSPEAAYQFHSRVCGTELSYSRDVVEIIFNNSEEFEI